MYQLLKSSNRHVIRLADNAIIPFSDENLDYQAYLAWLAEGNQPLPAED